MTVGRGVLLQACDAPREDGDSGSIHDRDCHRKYIHNHIQQSAANATIAASVGFNDVTAPTITRPPERTYAANENCIPRTVDRCTSA